MNPDHQHFFVVRPIEDADSSALRESLGDRQK